MKTVVGGTDSINTNIMNEIQATITMKLRTLRSRNYNVINKDLKQNSLSQSIMQNDIAVRHPSFLLQKNYSSIQKKVY